MDEDGCPIVGACCFPYVQVCLDGLDKSTCSEVNGVYKGTGSICSDPQVCPRLCEGDANADGVVDPLDSGWLDLPGEEIPLEDASADTVLLTYTLCTIPDFRTALAQMRRVLKPGGRLLFSEHGASPDANVRKWQDRINPLWKKLAGGCNINREIPVALEEAGFAIAKLETMVLPGTPAIAAFQYWGHATHA